MAKYLVPPQGHEIFKINTLEADHLLNKGWKVATKIEIFSAQAFGCLVDETQDED